MDDVEDEDDDDPEIKNDPIYVMDLQVSSMQPLKFKVLMRPLD